MKSNELTKIVRSALFWFVIVVIAVYMLFPFYWAINSSFKTENQLQMTPATFLPRDPKTLAFSPQLLNYRGVFQNAAFGRGLINSIVVAVSTTLLSLIIGSFASFALGKLRFRGKTPSLYLILSMTMFPQVAVLTGLYLDIGHDPIKQRCRYAVDRDDQQYAKRWSRHAAAECGRDQENGIQFG